jgi:hypothetical protein
LSTYGKPTPELEQAIISATGTKNATRFVFPIGDPVTHLENAIPLLYNVLDDVDCILGSYDDLLEKCIELNYQGNPLASQINNWNLREKLEQNLYLPPSKEMWETVSQIVERNNLVEYFKWERDLFKKTIDPLNDLITVMKTCKEVAKADPELFVKSVEFNQIPLRQYFFRVFNMWCVVQNRYSY